MEAHVLPYLDAMKNNAIRKIDALLMPSATQAIARDAFAFHFSRPSSFAFQRYYCEITNNRPAYLSSRDFFRRFKTMYSLQGIDGAHLDRLENQKRTLLDLVDADSLAELYFGYFADVTLQYGNETRVRSLSSFFAKFTHTFKPAHYCALDNPIRKYLGLGRESFYIAFVVISRAYVEWVERNPGSVALIRTELETNQIGEPYSAKMTDLKLLDLIFWHQANPRPAPVI